MFLFSCALCMGVIALRTVLHQIIPLKNRTYSEKTKPEGILNNPFIMWGLIVFLLVSVYFDRPTVSDIITLLIPVTITAAITMGTDCYIYYLSYKETGSKSYIYRALFLGMLTLAFLVFIWIKAYTTSCPLI